MAVWRWPVYCREQISVIMVICVARPTEYSVTAATRFWSPEASALALAGTFEQKIIYQASMGLIPFSFNVKMRYRQIPPGLQYMTY